MLFPLNPAEAVSDVMPTDWTFTPGAKMSTDVSKLEKEALASVEESMAPTVMAVGAEAGEVRPASCWGGCYY